MKNFRLLTGLAVAALALTLESSAAPKEKAIVSEGADGKIIYEADDQGDVVPDFSNCGYAGGDRAIPTAPVKVVVNAGKGDQTEEIQRAIDYVASLPLDANGLRGAVLLLKGRHEVQGGLLIKASGVVLRGQGMGEDGTLLVATGLDRRTLVRIVGHADQTSRGGWQVKDDYVPVGAKSFNLKDASGLKAGDTIKITRPSTEAWINDLSATEFGGGIGDWRLTWHAGTRDLVWDRVVQSVQGNRVTLDAPITTAMETKYGGGTVEVYDWPGRITNVGVENLCCESTYDPANRKDEAHAWMAITMENTANAWVRRVTARHFASSLVSIWENCKWVTVMDCLSQQPISEEGGYRRHSFFTMGQMTLFLRCWAEYGWHDFSVGHCAAGPNAFVQCEASLALRDSGPIESWASGVLYDNVRIDGNALSLGYRGGRGAGAAWSCANSVLWQCSASVIRCVNPPTAQNWAFGCWAEFEGNGTWRGANNFVNPDSLYIGQVADRVGNDAAAKIHLLSRMTSELTNPTVEQAAKMIAAARRPAMQLPEYIAGEIARDPLPSEPEGAKTVADILGPKKPAAAEAKHTISVVNGWIVADGKLLTGREQEIVWWRGTVRPSEAASYGVSLTRFVPGRIGTGYTDDLDELANSMIASGRVSLDYHYGLWYERRRDDHERTRRIDGDVWPPFFDQAFARTGQGTAWDGLSRYDLTKYSPWYWSRLKQFADICDQRGLVLLNQNFFQHNILEAGAHWVDCPWRTTNNVNNTDFPEPPPFAGDKRIFMAEQFYDVTNPARRPLWRAYIRQCLDNFKDNANVIQFTSAEFTGPLHFVQFWIDTIAEWEKETGRHALVALSCSKDVQDAILADPKRSSVVDVIDFRYWWKSGKSVYAPKGGQNLSPRQFERQWHGGRASNLDLAAMAAEYREKYPDKAVISDFEQGGWAYICAGGSLPNIRAAKSPELLAALPRMKTLKLEGKENDRYALAEPGKNYLVYAGTTAVIRLDLTQAKGEFAADWVDPGTGEMTSVGKPLAGGSWAELTPKSGASLLWVRAK